jgi:Holliday junction resolvase
MTEGQLYLQLKRRYPANYHRIESAINKGFPDVFADMHGTTVLIELKIAAGNRFKLTAGQYSWHDRFADIGNNLFLVQGNKSVYVFESNDVINNITVENLSIPLTGIGSPRALAVGWTNVKLLFTNIL